MWVGGPPNPMQPMRVHSRAIVPRPTRPPPARSADRPSGALTFGFGAAGAVERRARSRLRGRLPGGRLAELGAVVVAGS
jgi:hypothetical protein